MTNSLVTRQGWLSHRRIKLTKVKFEQSRKKHLENVFPEITFRLSLLRHPSTRILCVSRFTSCNKQKVSDLVFVRSEVGSDAKLCQSCMCVCV